MRSPMEKNKAKKEGSVITVLCNLTRNAQIIKITCEQKCERGMGKVMWNSGKRVFQVKRL